MERQLLWHQGLFLQPQHFQLSDRYYQSLLTPLYRYTNPHMWGVANMEIQHTALGTKSFHLLAGEFIFPDATYVVLPENALVQARYFEDEWVEGGKPFTVYLGLRKWTNAGENVTALAAKENLSAVTTRFIAPEDPEEVRDLYQDGPSAQLKRLSYVLKIFWETEKDRFGDYEIIPIAQLERSGSEVVLSKTFIPPSLTISASVLLEKIIREITDQVSARGHQLEAYKRERGIHSAEFGARDMVYLLAQRTLNRYIPWLIHLTDEKSVHPWMVYGLLRSLIGELSSFSNTISVTGESADGKTLVMGYQHKNLGECFSRAQSMISSLLDEITAGPEYVFHLDYDGTYFSAELPPAIFEGKNRFYLVIETEQEEKSVLSSLETAAKLSSREQLPILIVRALPAIKLKHLSSPPQELPRKKGALYFQIDHHSDQWTSVQKGKNLALFWDTAPEDLSVELMVVGRS
ncbi:MAG TPA: type VI secretion system baseplate subunit TssK [Deltaproteobacteria bacterium]|nr:type VI secretion system baseplate subunit TssK [Deltaproteobacteria bacterium]